MPDLRPKRQKPDEENTPTHTPPTKRKKTQADYSREFRQRMKEDPDKYNEHRDSQKKRRASYLEMSEEATQRNRELQRARQKAYRERKKEFLFFLRFQTCKWVLHPSF